MIRENLEWRRVVIPNSTGEKLVGILDDTGSEELAVLCHGFRSSKEHGVLINLASSLLQQGMSTFRFDFSGSGESEGEFHYGNYWKDVEDLRSVVTHWVGQGRVVKVLIGHSKGGNAVLLYVSKYKGVDLVVNLTGRFHLRRGMKKRLGENFLEVIENRGFVEVKDRYGNVEYRVNKQSLEQRLSINMKEEMLSIPESCRVLTMHGSKDEIVSIEEAKEFNRWIPNHKLQVVDGADHDYRQHQRTLCTLVLEFLWDEHTFEGIMNKAPKCALHSRL